jgi:hypothetical protein
MSSMRPEYVHCALTGMHGGDPPAPLLETWCGRPPEGWEFANASHALLHGRQRGRLMLCPGCAAEIGKVLAEMTWDGTVDTPETDEDEEGNDDV